MLLNRSATEDDDDEGLINVEDFMVGFEFAVVENENVSAAATAAVVVAAALDDELNRSEAAANDVGLMGSLVNIFLEFASLNRSKPTDDFAFTTVDLLLLAT